MAQKTYEEIFWISIAVMFGLTIFFYLLSRIVGTAIGEPKSYYNRKATIDQVGILSKINYAATDEELVGHEDDVLDFFDKYNGVAEREHLNGLTGQLYEALANRRAKLNHKYIFS